MTIGDLSPLPPIPTVAILTLGCKLNQAESEAIARDLHRYGVRVVDRPAVADAYVINSCSVTHVADRKSRHLVRLARRLAPTARVVLTGCYAASAGVEAARVTGADAVIAARDTDLLVADVLAAVRRPVESVQPEGLRTRAFVKAQEGCNDVCAFCIVPRTRGRERSLSASQVTAAVQERERDGVQEVVITGTQLGAWGRDLDGLHYGPAALISEILAGTAVPRIRFSSLQPQDITEELLALWDDPRLCRHFHLALQSGSDSVLRRMRRRYTIARYRAAVELIRRRVPGAALTTDVIAGFPGETDLEAAASLAFCHEAAFAQMHVFPYSRRPGTLAHVLTEHVAEPVKRQRMQAMLELADQLARQFRRASLGQTAAVLWESCSRTPAANGAWEGLTDTYVRVWAAGPEGLRNRITPVLLERDGEAAVWGRLDRLPVGAQPEMIPLLPVDHR